MVQRGKNEIQYQQGSNGFIACHYTRSILGDRIFQGFCQHFTGNFYADGGFLCSIRPIRPKIMAHRPLFVRMVHRL